MDRDLKEYIDNHIENNLKEKDITDVISLRPGYGKTQYIISKMSEVIQKKNKGLLIVTDSIERLENIANGNSIDYEIREYIDRNKQKIALLTADNIRKEITGAKYTPVICMTTQRFFRMTPKEINKLIRNSNYSIDKVFIDEQPPIAVTKRIGITELTRVDEAINKSLTNLVNQDEKKEMKKCFNKINTLFRKTFEDIENKNEQSNYTSFYYDDSLEYAGKTLFYLADKYRSELNNYNFEVLEHIELISLIAIHGAMVISQKIKTKDDSSRYDNYLYYVYDYRKWYSDINTKIIVFDGTANINPLYNTEYFNIIDCSKYENKLSNLIINIIDIPASKTKLQKNSSYRKAVIDYLNSKPVQTQAIFTYKTIKDEFYRVTDRVQHFGNIKGSNDYRELTNITQIGLNRYPDYIYQSLTGFYSLTEYNEIPQINLTDNSIKFFQKHGINISEADTLKCKKITKYVTTKHLIEFKNRLLLVDIIQNIFRSAIRNTNNKNIVTYNLCFGYVDNNKESDSNKMLVQMISKYFTDLGASITKENRPLQLEKLKTLNRKGKTNSQLIIEWINSQESGRIFKPLEMRQEIELETGIEIKSDIFYSTKQSNKYLNNVFNNMKISHGLYKIPAKNY